MTLKGLKRVAMSSQTFHGKAPSRHLAIFSYASIFCIIHVIGTNVVLSERSPDTAKPEDDRGGGGGGDG